MGPFRLNQIRTAKIYKFAYLQTNPYKFLISVELQCHIFCYLDKMTERSHFLVKWRFINVEKKDNVNLTLTSLIFIFVLDNETRDHLYKHKSLT